MAVASDSTSAASSPRCTASRKPSAAAMVNLLPDSFISTPVNTGRESSAAAAKAVREMAVRRGLGVDHDGHALVDVRDRRELLGVDAVDVGRGLGAGEVE